MGGIGPRVKTKPVQHYLVQSPRKNPPNSHTPVVSNLLYLDKVGNLDKAHEKLDKPPIYVYVYMYVICM